LGRKPIPRLSFLDDCDYLGLVHGARRWRSRNGKRLFTWDSLHGEIEVFDLLGRHVAVLNADGEWRKGPVSGRRIDV
jgi:Cytotoxic